MSVPKPSAVRASALGGATRKTSLPGGVTAVPSPVREARTRVRWMPADLPRADRSDYGSAALPLSHLVLAPHRPAGFLPQRMTLVYFYSGRDEDRLIAFEERALQDDRLGVTSWLLNCVRICVDDLPVAQRQAYSGGPQFVLLDREGAELSRLDGWDLSAPALAKAMTRVLEKDGIKVDKVLRAEGDRLKKIDTVYWKLEDGRFDLAQMAEREGKSADRQREKLTAQLAEWETELAGLMKEEQEFLSSLTSGSGLGN